MNRNGQAWLPITAPSLILVLIQDYQFDYTLFLIKIHTVNHKINNKRKLFKLNASHTDSAIKKSYSFIRLNY